MDAEDGPMDPLLTPSPIRQRRRKPLAFVCVCSFQVSGGWAPASLSLWVDCQLCLPLSPSKVQS